MFCVLSSNRSIKRRKFDDELVEYSLGLPGVSNIKVWSPNKSTVVLCNALILYETEAYLKPTF